MMPRKIFAVVGLLFLGSVAGAGATTPDPLDAVRELYHQAAEEEGALEQGLDAVAALRSESRLGTEQQALLDAYEAALVTLKAKYVFWPTTRMRYVNQGLGVLDRLVSVHAEDSEIRYLRLMSGYYLPSFLGRGDTVREDFAVLARTLPADVSEIPAELYQGIGRFVLANGRLPQEETRLLRQSLD
jgi:hypothetical protein